MAKYKVAILTLAFLAALFASLSITQWDQGQGEKQLYSYQPREAARMPESGIGDIGLQIFWRELKDEEGVALMIPVELYILLASIMFTIGLYGLITQRNGVKLMMCIELLLNSANINLVAFSTTQPNVNGQVFALFSIALAAAEAGVGFAILISLYRLYGTIDLDNINTLRW
jgi:NADH:ubiquinone oxidoreductase subunit K